MKNCKIIKTSRFIIPCSLFVIHLFSAFCTPFSDFRSLFSVLCALYSAERSEAHVAF